MYDCGVSTLLFYGRDARMFFYPYDRVVNMFFDA